MLKFILKIVALIMAAIIIFLVHTIFGYILPYPFNLINPIFIILGWLIIYKTSFKLYWLAILISFIAELFSGFPFGFITATLLINLFVISWLVNVIFTNRVWYIIIFCALISGLGAKLFFLLVAYLMNFLINFPIEINFAMLLIFFWEIVINAILLALFYSIGVIFFRRLNPRYLHSSSLFYG